LIAITAPTYQKLVGGRQECLGRLVFEVGGEVQWPTFYDGDNENKFARSFSSRVFNSSDVMRFGNSQIAVFDTPTAEIAERVRRDMPAVAIERHERYIREAELRLKKEKGEKEPSEYSISGIEDSIKSWKDAIAKIKAERLPFDPGVVGGEGFLRTEAHGGSQVDNYSIYRAYITRGNRIFVFESTGALDGKFTKESHAREFSAFLKNFRNREEGEIPSEIGVCIPYGFIRDDGKTLSDIKQSFRMPDAPGVLYTIHTGSFANNRATIPALKATSFASVGKMGTDEDKRVKPFVAERIGPRPYKIGGMSAIQGGVAVKIAKSESVPYETYQIFTGYSGSPGVEALPFIFVEMNTTTMNMAPELKKNPPPFNQSMGRLETLLTSMRLRSTTPPMPDMINIGKK
jgi:hypothetical protein